ncbi:MAG: serine hydrolase domain-containing protein [Anaerolineae bacterium]|jgi:CubicO group peptidase (beta-lactamase class C family)|nr:beta-lactamase family protein [Chloroflexota bacterium]
MSVDIAERNGFSPSRLARIAPTMQGYVDRGELPGIATLVARNGEIVHRSTVGLADIESGRPLGEDAIYRVYSMSKPVIVAGVLSLLEEGRLALDDPAQRYIPELGEMQVLAGMDGDQPRLVPQTCPMTVRHLMAHTSGMTYGFFADDNWAENCWAQAGCLNADLLLRDMPGILKGLPLLFQPGERWHYSVSIDVLGLLIEVISGQTLDVFLQERLFGPLGMQDTAFWTSPENASRLATLYSRGEGDRLVAIDSPGGPFDRPRTFLSGGGGLTSTISDYWRFAQMLANGGTLNGARVLGPRTVRLMRSNHLPPQVRDYGNPPALGHDFGLGVRIIRNPAEAGELGSVGNFGWSGLASTDYWVDPAENLVGICMMQYIAPPLTGYPVHWQFRTLTYSALVD